MGECGLIRCRDNEEYIGIAERSPDEFHHALLQFVCRVKYTWRIRIDDLPIVIRYDAHDAVTRRLRFGIDDAQPLSNKSVH